MSKAAVTPNYQYHRFDSLDSWTLEQLPDEVADRYMVDRCGIAMQVRMTLEHAKGRSGWNTGQCSDEKLYQMLKEHIEKGDMVDVLNLAGMLFVRQDARKREKVCRHRAD